MWRRRSQGHRQFLTVSTEGKDSAPNETGESGEFWRTSPSSWDLMAAEGGVARAPQADRATMGNHWGVLAPMCPWVHGSSAAGQDPGPWWEPRTSHPSPGPPTLLVLLMLRDVSPGPPAEIRRAPLPKSTTTSRTLPRTHLFSVTPPEPHGVPGPPWVPGCAPVPGSCASPDPRADATSSSPRQPQNLLFWCSFIGCRPLRGGTTWTGS